MTVENPWLSIVTVVKDDPDGFSRTIRSLFQQGEHDGVQWVVVDSSDPRVVPDPSVVAAGIDVEYAWVPPAGVYAAMNAALPLCRGQFAWFLNAGDTLASSNTLHNVRRIVGQGSPLWLIGQVAFVDTAGRKVTPPPFDFRREQAHLFARGRFAPHQGTLVRTDWLVRHGGFDTTYRIAADYKVSLELSRESEPLILTDVVADFHRGGASTTHWDIALREFHRARMEVLAPSGLGVMHEAFHTLGQRIRASSARALGRS